MKQQLSDRQEHAQGEGDGDDALAMATPSRKFNSVDKPLGDAKMVNKIHKETMIDMYTH